MRGSVEHACHGGTAPTSTCRQPASRFCSPEMRGGTEHDARKATGTPLLCSAAQGRTDRLRAELAVVSAL